jgi:hypothetical protein
MKAKQATRPARGGGVVMTGAKDQDGVLVELTGFDIERITRDEIDNYRERRQAQIDGQAAKAREANDFESYTEAFVAAGGREPDAKAAWEAKKKADATEAADRINTEVLTSSRRRVRQAL